MQRRTVFKTTVRAVILSGAALGIGAAMDSGPRTLMSPTDYQVAKRAIEADTRLSLARCREASGTARDVCKAEARAEDRIKKAELAARYHGTVTAMEEVRLARAKALYDVARARCSAHPGEQRMDCLRAAREDRNKSIADSKLAST